MNRVPRWIRLLVALHPPAFRERFGDEIEDAATQALQQPHAPRGTAWFLATDLLASAIREHVDAARTQRITLAVAEGPPPPPLTHGERMNFLWQDFRYAARSLLRAPAFTLTVIVSLAFGIGANALVYSLVDGIILRPFPYPDADRLVTVGVRYASDRDRRYIEAIAPGEYEEIRNASQTLERFFAFDLGNRNLSGGDFPERVFTGFIWGDPFATIGLRPWLGRGFTESETTTGEGESVAILSHRIWQTRFGSDSSLVGRTVEVNGVPRTVVGIMPPQLIWFGTDLWLPMGVSPSVIPRSVKNWAVVARMRPGVSMEAVQVELATTAGAIARNWEGQHEEYRNWSLAAATWAESVSTSFRAAGLVMLGAVGFVLLLAAANIASLMLARATVRQRELAVRSALGARVPRLARQLLTESMMLAIVGGGVGVLLAYLLLDPAMALFPPNLAGFGMTPSINQSVLLVTAVATIAVGLFTSLAPVAQVARRRGTLGLAATGRLHASRSTRRVRQVFTVAQVAIAVILLSGATVMLRSMDRLNAVDTGIDHERILTMRLSLPMERFEQAEVGPFFEMVAERMAALPGVASASAATQFPPGNFARVAMVTETPAESGTPLPQVDITNVTTGHATTLGLQLVQGRALGVADNEHAPRVAQLNLTAARRFFGEANPIGQRVGLVGRTDTVWHEVVGLVSDARNRGLDVPVAPEVFVPVRQQAVAWNNQLFLLVRATGNPAALAPSVRGEMRAIDPLLPVYLVRTMADTYAQQLSPRRTASTLLVSFAVIALLLAAVGIYGILSYLVSTRTHEIGVRMALGANERSVARLVMRETLLLVGAGAVIGLVGVVAMRGTVSAIAFEVGATDPLTLGVSLALLLGVATLAGFVPTRRAVHVDPLEALRSD